MAKLYAVDGTISEVLPKNPKEGFSLEELQGYVGGYIEVLNFRSHGKTVVLNEEGKLDGLPINWEATSIFDAEFGPGIDVLVGPVLVCEPKEVQ